MQAPLRLRRDQGRRLPGPITLVCLLLPFGLFAACKFRDQGGDDPSELLNDKSPRNRGLALIEKKDLVARPMVHAVRLDDAEFRVNGLRVGEQVYLRHATPVVSFEIPAPADYVDILRCPSNTIIFGGSEDIDQVELGAKDGPTETRIFQRNNFWEVAVKTSGCVLATSSYSDSSFEDAGAPTGKYHYYVHACVEPSRLIAGDKFSNANCSRQVLRSPEYNHTNQRERLEREALLQAADLRSKIDTIGRRIIEKTSLLNDQLYDCQQRHNKRVLDHEMKTGIATILAIGMPIVGAFVVGAAAKRASVDLTLEGSKKSLASSLSSYDDLIKKKVGPEALAVNKALSDKVGAHIKKVDAELDQLQQSLDSYATRPNSSKAIQAELRGRLDKTRLDRGEFARFQGSLSAANQADTSKVAPLLKSNAASATTTNAAAAAVGAGVGGFVASVFAAGSQPVAGYPQDAELCYNRKNEGRIAAKAAAGSTVDPSLICSCADALATQIDLNTLATDLQQQKELYQAQIDSATLAQQAAAEATQPAGKN